MYYQDEYSFQRPFQQQAYNNGRQGYTGGGMISQLDNARIESRLADDKYRSGYEAFQGRNGDPNNAPGWYQLQEMKAIKDRDDNIIANGGQTPQMFSRPQFELDSAMANFNEMGNLWGNKKNDVNRVIDSIVPGLAGENRGQHMASMSFGLASGGMGQGSEGGGDPGSYGSGIHESSYTTNNGQHELISNLAGGQLQRWAEDPNGGLHTAGMVNSPFTAFSKPGQYQGQSTAGGFAGIPASQQPAPNVREYGAGGMGGNFHPDVRTPMGYGSGMSDVDTGSPYQMLGDRNFGRMENITEEGYGVADGAPDDNYEPKENDLPHPDELENDDWDEGAEGYDQDLRSTNQQIKDSINNRAESQMTGNESKDLEVEGERQKALRALDDYSKKGFLPGYRPEDGSRPPSELSAYKNSRESGMIRRAGEPLEDAADSLKSGAKQLFNRATDGIKKVFQLSPPELSDDERFENVRKNVRFDGKMSRPEAQSAGEILTPKEQESLDNYKLQQMMNSIKDLQSHALGSQNPQIANAFDDENADYMRGPNRHHEFGPMEAGQIEAQMSGTKKSPRMDNNKRQVTPMAPPTHKEVLAQYIMRSLMSGGIG
jgi:hypothetical protein